MGFMSGDSSDTSMFSSWPFGCSSGSVFLWFGSVSCSWLNLWPKKKIPSRRTFLKIPLTLYKSSTLNSSKQPRTITLPPPCLADDFTLQTQRGGTVIRIYSPQRTSCPALIQSKSYLQLIYWLSTTSMRLWSWDPPMIRCELSEWRQWGEPAAALGSIWPPHYSPE